MFPNIKFHYRCNWKQTWQPCNLPWQNWWHSASSQSYSISCWWNQHHSPGNQRYLFSIKVFESLHCCQRILFVTGTQNDLDQKLEEIVCSIGFNNSVVPTKVVTTSPISKNFIFKVDPKYFCLLLFPFLGKDVPAGGRRNFYHYKVNCQGPCEDVLVDLRVIGDADLYVG